MTLPQMTDAALTVEGRVAVLTFERDDVRNALTSTALVEDIPNAIEWANANPAVSVLVMTGEGSAFSAGGNIKTMGERSKAPPHVLQQNYRSGIRRSAPGSTWRTCATSGSDRPTPSSARRS